MKKPIGLFLSLRHFVLMAGLLFIYACDATSSFTDNITDSVDSVVKEVKETGESVIKEVGEFGEKVGSGAGKFVEEIKK